MKHLLNNMSEEEKNSIREQHAGGMKVMIENFSKLVNSKLGDSKPLVSEQNINPIVKGFIGEQQSYGDKLRVVTDPNETGLWRQIKKDDILYLDKKNRKESDGLIYGYVLNVWDDGTGEKRATIEMYNDAGWNGEITAPLNDKNHGDFGEYKIIQNWRAKWDRRPESKGTMPPPPPIKKPKPPSVTPPPVTTPEKNKFNGKTVNLFSNPQETMFDFQVKITNERVVENKVYFGIEKYPDRALVFDCTGKLYLSGNQEKQYYNKKFIDSLKTNFCSAKVGTPPKSDFAP